MDTNANILIVEDSKFFNNLVRKTITERIGVDIETALSFAETRQIVESGKYTFDLALVDIVLPDAPEGEAIDWLMERGIPCIVFTGSFSEAQRERLLAQNVIDYVVKDTPSSLDYLVRLVDRLLLNRGVKVLVVDDSTVARRHIAELLRLYRFQVFEAKDGLTGLAELTANPDIGLVVTDYHMPDMDGTEMVKRMRVTHDQDRLGIIGVSSGGGGALSAKFIKSGANDFINKPFLREEFFCRVMQNVRMLDMVERLTKVATTDPLTGLQNRRFFFEAAAPLFASAKREQLELTIAMVDVDFFKKINDTHGHDGGDTVLKRLSALLRSGCRQTDVVARFGGEEFVILAVNMPDSVVMPFFDNLRAMVEGERFIHGAKQIPVTASFGVCHGVGDSIEAMLKTADEMLYRAKEKGRNRVEIA